MNGLKYIRKRCNLSLSELALELGISRQALSSWENGTKKIPEKRLNELSLYFGVNKELLLKISDKEKNLLINKAMFKTSVDGKERYSYKKETDSKDERIYFFGDDEETIDERYSKAKKRKSELMNAISELIDGPKANSLIEKTYMINGSCYYFEALTTLLSSSQNEDMFFKAPIKLEMKNILEAMLIAYTKLDISKVKEEIEANNLSKYQDYEFIIMLAEILSNHWDERKEIIRKEISEIYKSKEKEKKKTDECIDEKVKLIEEDHKSSNESGKNITYIFK